MQWNTKRSFTFLAGSLKPLTCAWSFDVSIFIVVTFALLLSIFKFTDERDDMFLSLSSPLGSMWNGFLALITDSFALILSLKELRNGFVEILMVGDATVEVVIIVVEVIMSSANGLLLIDVLVFVVSTAGDLCPFSTFDPLVTGTLIFSTTWMSEKCVTVTDSLDAFVGTRGIIDGKLQTFGVVGDGRYCDWPGEPPFKFSVSLSPPYRTIFTRKLMETKMIKTHKTGRKKRDENVWNAKR